MRYLSLLLISNFLVMAIFITSINFVLGESDFLLEMNNVNEDPEIVNFILSGDGYKEICPSGQCEIGKYTHTIFTPPSPTGMSISYFFNFELRDDITNKDLGQKKKEFLEQFSATMVMCKVNDILEDSGQEIYYCSSSINSISRNFDSKYWYFDSIGIYDAKKDTYIVSGNFTNTSPSKQ